MSIQRTYAMLKPGVLQRRIVGEVLTRIERKGLNIVALKIMQITEELAKEHYAEHVGKPFFDELVSYITSAPVVAMVIEGNEAIAQVRKLCGATKVEESAPGTIRGDFSARTNCNVIHASDSVASAEREIGLFFMPEDIVSWNDGNSCWF